MLGPGVTRYSPTPAREASPRRSSLALFIRKARTHWADCHRGRSSSGGACHFERAQQGAHRAAGTAGNSFRPRLAPSPQTSESSRAARQSGVAPNAAASRPPAPTDELPASDSNSGPKAPDQSGQTVADGIQSETSTAGTTGNTTGNTADNTAGNSTRNRPAPLSPPPVSANKGK